MATMFLLVSAVPASAAARGEFTYFAEAFSHFETDAAGIETSVSITAADRPGLPDEVAVEVTRANPACAAPASGCPHLLLHGFLVAPVAEGDVRIHPNLRFAHVSTTITFVDEISGARCAMTIEVEWRHTGGFAAEGEDGAGFRSAAAAGTVSCGSEQFFPNVVSGELGRYVVAMD